MKTLMLCIVFTCLVLSACDSGVNASRGFSLPQGDPEAGKLVFVKYQCLSCHTLNGFESYPEHDIATPVTLGGISPKVTTYAQLVSSIINPSHVIARKYRPAPHEQQIVSPMRNYNDVMTVTELTDLVVFLQPFYKVKPNHYTPYSQYTMH